MTTRSFAFAAVTVILAACTPASERAEERTAQVRAPIVGGTFDPGDPAVVEVVVDGEGECTGVLVAPRVVVTAAHCIVEDVAPGAKFAIFTGPDDSKRADGELVDVVETHVHPAYDVANDTSPADIGVLVLGKALAIAPLPYLKTPLPQSMVGQPVRMIGYGDNTVKEPTSGFGLKRQATSPLISFDANWVRVGTKAKNQCYGDSGGPVLMMIGGVETIVGVDSYGKNDDCDAWNDNTRLDTFASFVDPLVQAASKPAPPATTAPTPEAKGTATPAAEPDARGTSGPKQPATLAEPNAPAASGCSAAPLTRRSTVGTCAALALAVLVAARRSRRLRALGGASLFGAAVACGPADPGDDAEGERHDVERDGGDLRDRAPALRGYEGEDRTDRMGA